MYSLNAPVPATVARLASGLAADLRDADIRTRHTLLVKRFGDHPRRGVAQGARSVLAGCPGFEARVIGVGCFENPPDNRGPVAYLMVKSPDLTEIHRRLCEVFEPVPGLEGEEYVPHITVARRGDAPRLEGSEIDSISWTIDRLDLWDADEREVVESIALSG